MFSTRQDSNRAILKPGNSAENSRNNWVRETNVRYSKFHMKENSGPTVPLLITCLHSSHGIAPSGLAAETNFVMSIDIVVIVGVAVVVVAMGVFVILFLLFLLSCSRQLRTYALPSSILMESVASSCCQSFLKIRTQVEEHRRVGDDA